MLDIQNFKVMDEQKIEMLRQAINTHISMLYRQKDIYQRNGNTEGAKDCLAEIRKYQTLKSEL